MTKVVVITSVFERSSNFRCLPISSVPINDLEASFVMSLVNELNESDSIRPVKSSWMKRETDLTFLTKKFIFFPFDILGWENMGVEIILLFLINPAWELKFLINVIIKIKYFLVIDRIKWKFFSNFVTVLKLMDLTLD